VKNGLALFVALSSIIAHRSFLHSDVPTTLAISAAMLLVLWALSGLVQAYAALAAFSGICGSLALVHMLRIPPEVSTAGALAAASFGCGILASLLYHRAVGISKRAVLVPVILQYVILVPLWSKGV
jgi:hypothetical protein